MATVVRDIPYHDRRIAERRGIAYPAALRADGVRVSWGGVFGGVLVALGFLLLMAALGRARGVGAFGGRQVALGYLPLMPAPGVAVGISAAHPGATPPGPLGAGAGI